MLYSIYKKESMADFSFGSMIDSASSFVSDSVSGIANNVGNFFENIVTGSGGSFMSSSRIIDKRNTIYSTDWTMSHLFSIEALYLANPISNSPSVHFGNPSSFASNFDIINAAIQEVTLPQVSFQPIQEFVGGEWIYTTGRPEIKQLTFTFRDYANGSLYSDFLRLSQFLKNKFPEEQYWKITINSRSKKEYMNGLNSSMAASTGNAPLVGTSKAILESIGAVTLDQTSKGSFMTFTITFLYSESFTKNVPSAPLGTSSIPITAGVDGEKSYTELASIDSNNNSRYGTSTMDTSLQDSYFSAP
jgi:hypothetical protein